nr:immunoglobulin heavy chain junction region [Macaca mulatta]MOW46491.1 immunoglobulin heavy chain junction region [Macaca mulatta]MOW46555.1 immunoglobulin heavy chain junction region [Macaca mulatta]MOW46834.1 immunoglobulin heavy chain junction region [Macaca mulatta]MOW47714.1 immunoglobulin heavy chain junction region [Macaca mulatta]
CARDPASFGDTAGLDYW